MDAPEIKIVYIIVLNYNGANDTGDCLKSINNLSYPNYKVVVVDNASTDGSLQTIESWQKEQKKEFVVIKNNQNNGYAAGNNTGIRYAMSQTDFGYAWILNNDTLVEPYSLSALVARTNKDKHIGLCGSLVYNYPNQAKVQFQGGGRYNPVLGTTSYVGEGLSPRNLLTPDVVEHNIGYISGASVLATKDFLETVGLMGEQYFLFYEEVDWALRARNKYEIAYAPDSIIFHKGGAALSNDNGINDIGDFNAIRSRILITVKYFPYLLPMVYLGILFVTFPKRLLKGRFRRAGRCLLLLITLGRASLTGNNPTGKTIVAR